MKAIDLFCGVGGATLGFKNAGFEVVLAVDIDKNALECYKVNHPEVPTLQTDILDLSVGDLPQADVILGSTPCTSFSIANRNRTCDMTLTNHFLDIVADYKPKFWILENVPPLSKHLPKSVSYNILNAADYGVPQRRRRCIAGRYPFPLPTHSKNGSKTYDNQKLEPWVRFGKIKHPEGARILSKRGIAGAFKRANLMGQRGYRFDLQFIDENDIVPTICATGYHGLRASTPVVYDCGVLRQLSWIECVRAQSFPDDYHFSGTVEQKYHMVGDAVPPRLAEAIARSIKGDDNE